MAISPPFWRWLIVAASAEWLFARVLTRSAIFMPKAELAIKVYHAMTSIGQLAFTASALLVYGALLWMAWAWRRSKPLVSLAFIGLTAMNIEGLFRAPIGMLALMQQLLLMGAILYFALHAPRRGAIVAAAALLCGQGFQLLALLQSMLGLPEPLSLGRILFNVGELLVVSSSLVLAWEYARGIRSWLSGLVAGTAFAVAYLVSPSMIGTLTIWAVGLTLYLPWPVYALSFGGAAATIIGSSRPRQPARYAVLLLLAGGYAPQLGMYHLLGLLAVWTLTACHEASQGEPPAVIATSQSARLVNGLSTEPP